MSRWLRPKPLADRVTEGTKGTEGDGSPLATPFPSPSVPSVPFVETSKASHEPSAEGGPPDLEAFHERVAIMEADGGLARADADRLAAEALGFADPAALYAAAADCWRRNLEALARCETSKRGQDCIAAALRFVRDGWAEKAAALGWPESELFGADPRAPWARLDRLGAAYSTFSPSAVTADCINYPGTGARPMRRWRGSQADGAALPWEGNR